MDNSTTESTKLECRKSCKSGKVRESIPGSQLLSDVPFIANRLFSHETRKRLADENGYD